MIVVGLEGTAHTAGVGLVDTDGKTSERILVNVIDSYRPEEGGIHPREAANHHASVFPRLIKKALESVEATGRSREEIALVAFSQGPGLGPCLRTTAISARTLALALDVPILGVNHCIAHLEIGQTLFPECKDPLLLYTSGGNTQVIAYAGGRYRVFGETLDIGIGNMLDKFAIHAKQPFPGGPKLEKLASTSTKYINLPYSVKGMDVAFSGILTAAKSLLSKGEPLADVANSLQETCFAMLLEVSERAMAHTEKDRLLLGGGVACNRRLQEMAAVMVSERGGEVFIPPNTLCVDNGAMIANLGAIMTPLVEMSVQETVIDQNFRTDDVEVTWK